MARVEFEFAGKMGFGETKKYHQRQVVDCGHTDVTDLPKVLVIVSLDKSGTKGRVDFVDKTKTEPVWVDGSTMYLNPTFGRRLPSDKTVRLRGGMILRLKTD